MADEPRPLEPPPANAPPGRPSSDDLKRQRRHDLLADGLDDPDPLRANLRAAMTELLEISTRLGANIVADMDAGPSNRELRMEVMPVVNVAVQVHRQITRYAQLDRELRPQ